MATMPQAAVRLMIAMVEHPTLKEVQVTSPHHTYTNVADQIEAVQILRPFKLISLFVVRQS